MQCPGCGLEHPDHGLATGTRQHASAGCWSLYCELAAYTLARNDPAFVHQHAVDAYAAQHTGSDTRPITTVYALVGLYLAVECGYTGRQVQGTHMTMAKKRTAWPALAPPPRTAAINVADVLAALPGAPRDAMLLTWASSVWTAWADTQAWIRTIAPR
jgi:Family of unknown function (DUF5946)